MNPHHIQITSLQLTDVTKLLDDIPLRMNCKVGKSRSLGPRAQAIGRHAENLAPPHKHCHVEADQICLPHLHCIGVIEKLLNQGIIACTNGSGHLRMEWVWVYRAVRGAAIQFYPLPYGRIKLSRLSRRQW
jgi:hypothetical protein